MSTNTNHSSSQPVDIPKGLQYARLTRIAKSFHLGESINFQLRKEIVQALFPLRNIQASSVPNAEPQKSEPEYPKMSVWKETAENYELKLRQLVQMDAPWKSIEEIAWGFYKFKPNTEVAVKVFEVCFLSGDQWELLDTFKKLYKDNMKFYGKVNKTVRHQLLLTNWKNEIGAFLSNVLQWQKENHWLLPLEKLFIYSKLLLSNDPIVPFSFLKLHQTEIFEILYEQYKQLGLSTGFYNLSTAKMFIALSKKNQAKSFLKRIQANEIEYKEALNLILQIDQQEKKFEQSHYYRSMVNQTSWQGRVDLLEGFFIQARNESLSHLHLSQLNLLVKSPLKWFPDTAEVWTKVSYVMASAFDLEDKLPDIQHFMRSQILNFHEKQKDLALWQPFLNEVAAKDKKFWKGIAYLHQYVATQGDNDIALWKTREAVLHHKPSSLRGLSWEKVDQAIRTWISSARYLVNDRKEKVLSHLAIAGNHDLITHIEIEHFFKYNDQIRLEVLEELNEICEEKHIYGPRIEIYKRISSYRSITNSDLQEIWKLGHKVKKPDFSWRVCSVMKARDVLDEKAIYAWQISGENRRSYNLMYPTNSDISLCTEGMGDLEKRLCFSLIWAGSTIHEMFFQGNAKNPNRRLVKPDTIEFHIDSHLNQIPWSYIEPKKSLFGPVEYYSNYGTPSFAQKLPINEWSMILAKLVERLGVDSWNWMIADLSKVLDKYGIELLDPQNPKLQRTRAGKLVKNLTPVKRKAIGELKLAAKKISNEKAAFTIATFLCRLTTCIFPYHFQALKSLQEMRVPLRLLRDQENWILSEAYEKVRMDHNNMIKIPVPNSLQGSNVLKR